MPQAHLSLPAPSSLFSSFSSSHHPRIRSTPPYLNPKQLLQLPYRVLRALYTVPHRPLIHINLVIIPALVRLVPEKVDRRVLDAANAFFFFNVL